MDEITIQFLKMGETLNKVLENQMSMKEEILKIQKDLIDFKVETRENFAKVNEDLQNFKEETRGNFAKVNEDLNNFKEETKENFAKHLKRMDDGFFTVQQLFKADSDGIRGFEKVNFS